MIWLGVLFGFCAGAACVAVTTTIDEADDEPRALPESQPFESFQSRDDCLMVWNYGIFPACYVCGAPPYRFDETYPVADNDDDFDDWKIDQRLRRWNQVHPRPYPLDYRLKPSSMRD